MTESRRSQFRRNVFRFGTLRFGAAPPTQCLVWDLSDTGALVEVDAPEAVPDRAELAIDGAGDARACAVARRDGRRIGLVFEG